MFSRYSKLVIFLACLLFPAIAFAGFNLNWFSGTGGSGNTITYSTQETVSAYVADDLTTDNAINVPSGATIIAFIGSQTGTTYCTAFTDSASNSYTVGTAGINGDDTEVFAYVINATASSSMTFTASFADSTVSRKTIYVAVFVPGSGETMSLDTDVTGSSAWSASPWVTSSEDTTGTDEVCMAGFQAPSSTITMSTQEIPAGSSATVLSSEQDQSTAFYQIFSSTQSGNYAEVVPSASNGYTSEMMCFKSQ